MQDGYGTALCYAAVHKKERLVEDLIKKGAKPVTQGRFGTPLHIRALLGVNEDNPKLDTEAARATEWTHGGVKYQTSKIVLESVAASHEFDNAAAYDRYAAAFLDSLLDANSDTLTSPSTDAYKYKLLRKRVQLEALMAGEGLEDFN